MHALLFSSKVNQNSNLQGLNKTKLTVIVSKDYAQLHGIENNASSKHNRLEFRLTRILFATSKFVLLIQGGQCEESIKIKWGGRDGGATQEYKAW